MFQNNTFNPFNAPLIDFFDRVSIFCKLRNMNKLCININIELVLRNRIILNWKKGYILELAL